ncbi:MAG: adenylate kinase [Planctomycetota bacterium]|nr:MAG: adenylate kinase [Planctomycetota bacterium]
MKVVFLGPPGAGKGTQAVRLCREEGITHMSTGEMLREAVKAGSEVGLKAKSYMDSGALVPDEVVIEIIEEKLNQTGWEESCLFDGFPRTVAQARALEEMLKSHGSALDHVIYLETSPEVAVERLGGRLTCRNCGANFHIRNMPPRRAGVCDECGGELCQRDDDRPESVQNRLKVYEAQTADLINYYVKKGLLRRVSGDLQADQVYTKVREALGL